MMTENRSISIHPANLGLRFILEMLALFAMGWWGYALCNCEMRYVWAVGVPLAAALVWGIFAVPGDPSRSGKTVVKTPGWIRLILELCIFSFGVYGFYKSGHPIIALAFGLSVALHYLISFDRLKWLMKH